MHKIVHLLCLLMPLTGAVSAVAEEIQLDGTPLMTSTGEEISFDRNLFSKSATIVSFTFTGCQSVCPATDLTMEALAHKVRSQDNPVGLLTFTIDPIADSADVLERRRLEIGGAENRSWITGRPQDMARVLSRLGMESYDLQTHPVFYLVVAAGGRIVDRIPEGKYATIERLLAGASTAAGR